MQSATIPPQYIPVSQKEFANIPPSVLKDIVVDKVPIYAQETVNGESVIREGIPATSMIGFLGPPYFYRHDGTPYEADMTFYVPPPIATKIRTPPSTKSRSKTRRQRAKKERRSKK